VPAVITFREGDSIEVRESAIEIIRDLDRTHAGFAEFRCKDDDGTVWVKADAVSRIRDVPPQPPAADS
jgi:hypothetical protein